MNTMLRHAKNEVNRLKESDSYTGGQRVDLVLAFDRSEEEMQKLVGYADFAKALEALGGQHTEENIQEACRVSGMNRRSVRFDDMKERIQHDDIHIPVKCTKEQARKLAHSNSYYSHSFIID